MHSLFLWSMMRLAWKLLKIIKKIESADFSVGFFVNGAFYWIENTIQSIWKWNERATFQVNSFDCRIKNAHATWIDAGFFFTIDFVTTPFIQMYALKLLTKKKPNYQQLSLHYIFSIKMTAAICRVANFVI